MVLIHIRDTRNTDRIALNDINLSSKVETLKSTTEQEVGISASEQRLVYLGRVLEDCNTLSYHGLADGCTVYVFKKPPMTPKLNETADAMKYEDAMSLATFLHKFAESTYCQPKIKQMLQDKAAVEKLILQSPALKKDPIALALIKDPDLLLRIAETANVKKITEEHPALAQAAKHVLANVLDGRERNVNRQLIPPVPFPLPQSSAAEANDMEEVDPGLMARAELIAAQEEGIQERQALRPQQISAMQLALALSQAGVNPQPSTSSQPPSQQPEALLQPTFPPASTAITNDFFSQAIASAIASTSQPQANSPSTPHQAALQQMRAMGITNDNLSLQALTQTGGDVQAALNLIFEGGLQ